MKKSTLLISTLIAATLPLTACGGKTGAENAEKTPLATATAPVFDADSAYNFVATQVAFGPRVPGSEAHARCVDYLTSKLAEYGGEVSYTDTVVTTVDGRRMPVKNISAVFNPQGKRRVLLVAHYDTRPWADKESDPALHNRPIDGANDGASGVAVLLEIARNINQLSENLAVEMLMVDAEDSGSYEGDEATWCVGSQLWASQRKPTDPKIDYGILLDMVGGRDAIFHREYFSGRYAPSVTERIWRAAAQSGYGSRFVNEIGGAVNDDHIYLMQTGIPVADIIESRNVDTDNFPSTWHTLADNMSNIDRATLKAVGDVVITVLKN